MVRNLPEIQEILVQSLGREDALEKGMASHSSILAWRIPWGPKELDTTERRTRSLSLFHAVERSNPERPHVPSSQFPYMVTSSKSQPAC